MNILGRCYIDIIYATSSIVQSTRSKHSIWLLWTDVFPYKRDYSDYNKAISRWLGLQMCGSGIEDRHICSTMHLLWCVLMETSGPFPVKFNINGK